MAWVETSEVSISNENDEVEKAAAEKSTTETHSNDQRIEAANSTETDGSARDSTLGTPPTTPKVSLVSKVTILLKPTADAPIMKQKKWEVEPEKKIGAIVEFIKKYLKLQRTDSLFLYVNQSFAPAPDQTVKNLYECFGADGKLVLHYCKSQAWG